MADESERFLVTFTREDLEYLESACKKARLSRNRYIVIAVMEKVEREIASGEQSIASGEQSIPK